MRHARDRRITWRQALAIGLAQVLAAVFPGTSRSAATILGGLLRRPFAPGGGGVQFLPRHSRHVRGVRLFAAEVHQDTRDAGAKEILLMVIGTLVSFLVA